ncbi:MAG TPA: TonB-dependent receptor [Sphingomicrobium sp.]|jgi:iron complex outermembrane receptor protein
MRKGSTAALSFSALMLASAAMSPAYAQSVEKKDQQPAAETAENPDAIIVTANRREERLQDVAGVVQALTADELRRLGIGNDIRNLQAAVPGLNIANQEGNIEIFIRGVGSANNTELGDPAAAPHINGVYIPRPRGLGLQFYDLDRVEVNKGPQGTLYGRNALAGTLNIVTKEPVLGELGGFVQGQIGTRHSYGGEAALNVPIGSTSALRFAGYFDKQGSSFKNAGIDKTLKPAGIQDNVAGRVSFKSNINERLSIFLMGDYGQESGTGYPGANIYSAVRATGDRAEDLPMRDVVYRGWQGDLDNVIWGVQGRVSYDFGPFTAQYLGSYRKVDFEQTNSGQDGIAWEGRDVSEDGVQYDNYSTQFWQTRSKAQTHEIRLVGDTAQRLRWTVGAFMFDEKQQVGFLSLVDRGYCCYSGTEFTMPDVRGKSKAAYADGTFDITKQTRLTAGLRYTDEKKSRYGIGGNWALVLGGEDFACCFATRLGTPGFRPSLLDRPNFNVGALDTPQELANFLIEGIASIGSRDTLVDQIGSIAAGTNPLGTCFVRSDIDNGFVRCPANNPNNTNGGFSYANLTIPGQQVGSSKFNYWDWRLVGEHDLTPNNMLYAKVSTGHKSGGFNDSFDADLIPETFKPEKLVVYEVGSKNSFSFRGRRAIGNVSAFYYDYSDQVFQDLTTIAVDPQTGNATGFSLVNRNVGKSRLWGIEGEAILPLSAMTRLHLNAVYLDTEITKGQVADARAQDFSIGGFAPLIDLKGSRLPLASKWNLTGRLQHTVKLQRGSVDGQVLASYRSSFYLTQYNELPVVFATPDGTVTRVETALEAGFPDRQEGFVTVNLGVGYTSEDGRWRVEGYATNLFDVDASQKALVGSGINVRFLNEARSFGVRVRSSF